MKKIVGGFLLGALLVGQSALGQALMLSKSDPGRPVGAGEVVVYELSYLNTGPATVPDVVIDETIPRYTRFSSGASDPGWVCNGTAGEGHCTYSLGALPPGAGGVVIFAVEVGLVPAAVTFLENTAVIGGSAPGEDPVTVTRRTPIRVGGDVPPPGECPTDYTLTAADNDPATAGQIHGYTISAVNAGSSPIGAVALRVTVPESTTFAPGGSDVYTCVPDNGSGSECTVVVPDIQVGIDVPTTFEVLVDDVLPAGVDDLVLAASISALTGGVCNDPSNDDVVHFSPVDAVPDLRLTKAGPPGPSAAGDVLGYQLIFTNAGSQGASGVVLTETVPQWTVFDPATSHPGWVCIDASCTLSLGTVPVGGSGGVGFALEVLPYPSGVSEVVNAAQIADDGTNGPDTPGNNEGSWTTNLIPAVVDLDLAKTDHGVVAAPGDVVNYELAWSNSGNRELSGVVIVDAVPEHMRFVAAPSDPGWSCSGSAPGSLCSFAVGAAAPGSSGSVGVAFEVASSLPPGTDIVVNTAAISDDGAWGPDATPADNRATETTPLTGVFVDLAVSKSDGVNEAAPGDLLRYVVSVTNRGTAPATGVVLSETVPEHTQWSAAGSGPGWSCSSPDAGGTCSLTAQQLPVGVTVEVVFAVVVLDALPPTATEVVNTATVTALEADGNPADNTATDVDGLTGLVMDLAVSKSDRGASGVPGGTVPYEITVENLGNVASPTTALREMVPEGSSFEPAGSSAGWAAEGTDYRFDLPSLAAGAAVVIDFVVRVDEDPAVTLLSNEVRIDLADADPTNNVATETTPVSTGPAPQLVAFKEDRLAFDEDGDGLGDLGDQVAFETVVTNSGNAPALDVEMSLEASEHLAYLLGSAVTSLGTIEEADETFRLRVTQLDPGEAATVTFLADVVAVTDTKSECQGRLTAANAPGARTDDPDTPAPNDPTTTALDGSGSPGTGPIGIPTLGEWGLGALVLLLLVLGVRRLHIYKRPML